MLKTLEALALVVQIDWCLLIQKSKPMDSSVPFDVQYIMSFGTAKREAVERGNP